MADLVLEQQTGAAAGSLTSGNHAIFVDASAQILCTKDSSGIYRGRSKNCSIANQTGFAADTYVTNSNLVIPSFGLQAKTRLLWVISASKTAAGVAAPVFQIRIGANGTTADTSRLSLTGSAQTAVADVGCFFLIATVRNIGAAGVIQGALNLSHNGAAVGFASNNASAVEATSSAFDNSALGGLNIGLSINGGASAAWTLTQVQVEADW
jgi:hypothetical protein